MMKSSDESVEINHNPNWSSVPENPYRILIIGGSGSGKTNVLLNLIKQQPDIEKFICMSKINLNQSINCLSKEQKRYRLTN